MGIPILQLHTASSQRSPFSHRSNTILKMQVRRSAPWCGRLALHLKFWDPIWALLPVPAAPLPIHSLLMHLGKQRRMAQVLGCLLSYGRPRRSSSFFVPAQLWLWQPLRECSYRRKISLYWKVGSQSDESFPYPRDPKSFGILDTLVDKTASSLGKLCFQMLTSPTAGVTLLWTLWLVPEPIAAVSLRLKDQSDPGPLSTAPCEHLSQGTQETRSLFTPWSLHLSRTATGT